MRYVKKPVVIEAIQWTGDNLKEVFDFLYFHKSALRVCTWEEYEDLVKKEGLKIFTLEGTMMASVGDFIIKGVNGEVYPCKPDIFEKTYSVHQPKRKPLPDGTLPLTEEELKEFNELFYPDRHNVKILFRKGCVTLCFKSPFGDYLTHNWATNVISIIWLAKRFQLTDEV